MKTDGPGQSQELAGELIRFTGETDWRAEIFKACLRSGASFVFASLLLFGMYRFGEYALHEGIPQHLAAIKAGFSESQAAHDKNLERVIKAFEDERVRVAADQVLIRELLFELRRNSGVRSSAPPTSP